MEYSIYQTPKTVHCKLYDKQMTIYLNVLEYGGKRYIRSNECEHACSCAECTKCADAERRVVDLR